MNIRKLTDVALKTGEILLCSGAEIYRVEETIIRVFKSYGVNAECFVILSGIFITAHGENGNNITLVKRIKGHNFDLKKIELVNSFSRSLENNPLSYTEAIEILNNIEETNSYALSLSVVSAGLMAFVYALLFNGNIGDGTAAFFISMVNYYVKAKISEIGFFQFFEFFISGIIIGGLTVISAKLFPVLDMYKVIIGAVMIVVPGMALTTGIKDALYGDIVSSLYRLAEAAFIAAAVGSGVAIMLSIGLRYL